MPPTRTKLAALIAVAALVVGAPFGLAAAGVAVGFAALAAYGWRLATRWPHEPEMTRGRKLVEALFVASVAAWVASDAWRIGGFAGSGETLAAGPELLGHLGTLCLVASIIGVVHFRGGARRETWLDAASFLAALSAPAYLVFVRPETGDVQHFPWTLAWVVSTLVLLYFGGAFIMSGGRWNAPAVLVAAAVSAMVGVAVPLHLAAADAVIGVPRYVPVFVLVVFVALHPRVAEMHVPGGRPSGIPLSVRVWLLVGALFLPLGTLGWSYVVAEPVPVAAVVGSLSVMATVVAVRAVLLARAGFRDWSVPLTISLAALWVATVAVAMVLQSESARATQHRATALASQLAGVRALDGLSLRAVDGTNDRRYEARLDWARIVRTLSRTADVPGAALDAYVGRATSLLSGEPGGPGGTRSDAFAAVQSAHETLVARLSAAVSREQAEARRQARSVRQFTVLALMAALLVLATLLLRFNRAQSRLRLEHEKTHDALTDLPNRIVLERALRDEARVDGERRTLVVIDLDDFKAINDSYGISTGDAVIAAAAARLDGAMNDDELLVRTDGDAFAILVPATRDPLEVAGRALGAVSAPITLDGRSHTLYASAGLAEVDESDPERHSSAVRDAEVAMYEAKRTVGNSVRLFAPDMHERVRERIQLAIELREAISEDGLHLVYQPIVDLETGRIAGYEALVRWTHPTRGFMSPADFIPLAEQSGLIVDLGLWVLRTATAQLAAWQETWRDDRYVSVNVAAAQLQTGVLEEQVDEALRASGLAARRLLLEVTESSLIDQVDASVEQMRRIGELGVRFALDDFGTGYSSLSYLRRFPVDVLKIDKSFIDGLHEPDGALLVRAIVDMATSLRLSVVAEGIEEPGQAATLTHFGCALGQGFHFSRPIPEASVQELGASVAVQPGPPDVPKLSTINVP